MADRKKVTTPVFRASFVNVFEARAFEGGDAKYSVSAIWPEGTNLDDLKAIVKAAAVEKWGAKLPGNIRSPFRKGEEKEGIEGYGAGTTFTNITSKNPPGVVDGALQRIIDKDKVYAGCYMRATVTAYAYDQKGNKGVAFGLHNLQFVKDGDRIDGRARAEDDFSAMDVAAGGSGDTKGDDDFLS